VEHTSILSCVSSPPNVALLKCCKDCKRDLAFNLNNSGKLRPGMAVGDRVKTGILFCLNSPWGKNDLRKLCSPAVTSF